MVHWPNHHQKVSDLIDRFGVVGYGAYWILNELILLSPEKSMSKAELVKASKIRSELVDLLLGEKEHFYQIDGKYFSELDRKNDLTSADAYRVLDKAGLSGRGFTRIMQIHSVSEKFMMIEFEKWKKSRELEIFKDERHVFNSFNVWMRNCEKEKIQKPATGLNWDSI